MLKKSIHFIFFGAGLFIGYFLSRGRSVKKREYQSEDYEMLNEILLEKEDRIEQLQSQVDALLEEDEKSKKASSSKKVPADDLTVIEGIGPKTEEILNGNGIYSYTQLANTSLQKLRAILNDAGSVYLRHNPDTWSEQARKVVKAGRDGSK